MITKEEYILLHAEKLFAQFGFSGTSTREISAAAGVNISMISYYFGSKEKLYEAIFEYRMKEGLDFVGSVLEDQEKNAWQKMEAVVERYMHRVKNLREFFTILQREQIKNRNPRIFSILRASKLGFVTTYKSIIEEGNQSGLFIKKPSPEIMQSTISGIVFSGFNTFSVYKDLHAEDTDFEQHYFTDLLDHIKDILKHIVGYEEKH